MHDSSVSNFADNPLSGASFYGFGFEFSYGWGWFASGAEARCVVV